MNIPEFCKVWPVESLLVFYKQHLKWVLKHKHTQLFVCNLLRTSTSPATSPPEHLVADSSPTRRGLNRKIHTHCPSKQVAHLNSQLFQGLWLTSMLPWPEHWALCCCNPVLRLRMSRLTPEKKGHSLQRNPEHLDHLGWFVCFGGGFFFLLFEREWALWWYLYQQLWADRFNNAQKDSVPLQICI